MALGMMAILAIAKAFGPEMPCPPNEPVVVTAERDHVVIRGPNFRAIADRAELDVSRTTVILEGHWASLRRPAEALPGFDNELKARRIKFNYGKGSISVEGAELVQLLMTWQ